MTQSNLSFEEWLQIGVDRGYCTPQYCGTHDAPYLFEDEDAAFSAGADPCIDVVRVYDPEFFGGAEPGSN